MDHGHLHKVLAHCPLCQAAYPSSDVRLLGEKGTLRLFHCTCNSCGHAVLAVVLETSGSVSSVGLVTDLEVSDAFHFQNAKPVTSDECITFHQLLELDSAGFCRRLLDMHT
ncbi:MAG: hypothetical protein AAB879_03740 [Patescibacteria group bacterium]